MIKSWTFENVEIAQHDVSSSPVFKVMTCFVYRTIIPFYPSSISNPILASNFLHINLH